MREFLRRLSLLLLFTIIILTESHGYEDPVIWIYVKPKINVNNSISVNWGVMSEPPDHRYEIERSDNRQDFQVIANMPGRGSNIGDHHYRALDSKVKKGVIYYYRVSIVGPDGIPRYSPTVSVAMEKNQGDALVSLYPNPAQQTLFIEVNKERAHSGQITISDVAGVTRFDCKVEHAFEDSPLSVPVATWPRGMYVLSIITPGGDRQASRFFVKD